MLSLPTTAWSPVACPNAPDPPDSAIVEYNSAAIQIKYTMPLRNTTSGGQMDDCIGFFYDP